MKLHRTAVARGLVIVLTATLGAVVGGVTVAIARPSAGSPTATTVAGHAVTAMKIVRDSNPASTSATSWRAVPGARTAISVPNGQKAIIDARFASGSTCYTVPASVGYGCQVRILVDGVEAAPAGINASVFDSTCDCVDSREAHMIERSLGPVGAGKHVVTVEMQVPNTSVTLDLYNWSLAVERVRA